ncbi:uncharacterized protein V1516DRAFT_674852 [Lipomyces oligophaga]|uniref:uncharacterized protein n=1 Tax=Lipomyces oligophaga TaxID=45792 RepID=UPI0034CF4CFF
MKESELSLEGSVYDLDQRATDEVVLGADDSDGDLSIVGRTSPSPAPLVAEPDAEPEAPISPVATGEASTPATAATEMEITSVPAFSAQETVLTADDNTPVTVEYPHFDGYTAAPVATGTSNIPRAYPANGTFANSTTSPEADDDEEYDDEDYGAESNLTTYSGRGRYNKTTSAASPYSTGSVNASSGYGNYSNGNYSANSSHPVYDSKSSIMTVSANVAVTVVVSTVVFVGLALF